MKYNTVRANSLDTQDMRLEGDLKTGTLFVRLNFVRLDFINY